MPFDYTILSAERIVLAKAAGILTAAEISAHTRLLKADPLFDPSFDTLVDLTEMTGVQATGSEIALVATDTAFGPTCRRAIVVSSPASYGLGRMYAAYRDARGQPNTVVFDHLDKAWAWLRRAPQVADRVGA